MKTTITYRRSDGVAYEQTTPDVYPVIDHDGHTIDLCDADANVVETIAYAVDGDVFGVTFYPGEDK